MPVSGLLKPGGEEGGSAAVGRGDLRLGEEERPGEVGVVELCIPQVGTTEVRCRQVGAPEVRGDQAGTARVAWCARIFRFTR